MDDGLRNVHDSSDQSRSVLANMAGDAAEDLGQLGGVVGTLGVGIGQLAEYAVDGNIKLSNLAGVAGPLIGLSLALAGINKFMSERKRIEEWRTEQVEGYAAAVEEVGVGLGAIEEHLTNVAGAAFEAESGITEFLIGGEEIPNVAAAAGVLGINIKEMAEAINAGASDTEAGERALAELEQQLISAGYESGTYGALLTYITEQQDAYAQATADAAAETKFFAASAGDITGRRVGAECADRRHRDDLGTTPQDLRDGHIDTVNAAEAWNRLRDELGLSNEEMAELTQQKLDEKLEADAEAAEKLAAEAEAARQALADYNETVRSGDFGAAAFDAATTAAAGFFDTVLAEESEIADSQEAFDALAESVDAAGTTYMDLNSPEGRQTFGVLKQLGATIVPKVAQAFDEADGDLDKFRQNMHVVGEQTIVGLIGSFRELGYSEDEARSMANDLMIRARPGPRERRDVVQVGRRRGGQSELALLQESIGNLPEDVQTTVTQQIILGDYQGALATVQSYYNRVGATVPVDADLSAA